MEEKQRSNGVKKPKYLNTLRYNRNVSFRNLQPDISLQVVAPQVKRSSDKGEFLNS